MSLLSLFRGEPAAREERALTDWGPWNPSTSGVVNEVTAFNLSAVWACETLIADAIATMPVDVYRKTGDIREPISAPSWVETPNPWTNRIDFDTQRLLSLLGWGNSYTLLARRGGSADPMAPVMERYVVDPWRVDVRAEGALPAYYVDGEYVERGRIQHIAGYRRPGQLKGMSAIEMARSGLSASTAAEDLAKNLYENGLNTSGVVSIPDMPADVAGPQIERITDRIRQWYGGAKNAGKPMVLTGGTTWQPMSVTPQDAQFLETRKFQIEEIARWFRVSPHMIGHTEGNTTLGSSIEHQSMSFVQYTLTPWLVRLETSDSLLLPPGQFIKFNVSSLVRADLKTRYEAHQIAINSGMATPNNRLVLEDEPPVVGGDAVRVPAGVSLVASDGVPDATIVNAVGALVRAGYDPADVLVQLGLPAIKHLGLAPVTVQSEPDPPTPEPVDPQRSSVTIHNHIPEQAPVTVEASTFNVDARQDAPVINVPELVIPPTVVNVPEPKVVVERGTVKRTVHRDENGEITHTTEERG